MIYELREIEPYDVGMTETAYSDTGWKHKALPGGARDWTEADTHRCDMKANCIAGYKGGGKHIGIVLAGDCDQPRWESPFQIITKDYGMHIEIQDAKYVCEDCAGAVAAVFTVAGFKEETR